jgi:hypothetical protein
MKRKINTVDWSALDYPKPKARVVTLNRQRPEALEGNRTTQFAPFDWSLLDSPPRENILSKATIVRQKPRPPSAKPQKVDPTKDIDLQKRSAFTNLFSLTTQQIEQAATELKTLNDSVGRNGWSNQPIPLSFDNILQKHPWSPTVLQLGPLVQKSNIEAAINLLSAQSREDANWKRVSSMFFLQYYTALQYLKTQGTVAAVPQVNAWPANIPPTAAAAVPNRMAKIANALSFGTIAGLFTATATSPTNLPALQAIVDAGTSAGTIISSAISSTVPDAASAAISTTLDSSTFLTSASGLLGIIMGAAIVSSVGIGPIKRAAEAAYAYLPSPLDLLNINGSWDQWQETWEEDIDIFPEDSIPSIQIEEVLEEKKVEARVIDPAKHSPQDDQAHEKDEPPPSPRATPAPAETLETAAEKKLEEEQSPASPRATPAPAEGLETAAEKKLEEEPSPASPTATPAPAEALEKAAEEKLAQQGESTVSQEDREAFQQLVNERKNLDEKKLIQLNQLLKKINAGAAFVPGEFTQELKTALDLAAAEIINARPSSEALSRDQLVSLANFIDQVIIIAELVSSFNENNNTRWKGVISGEDLRKYSEALNQAPEFRTTPRRLQEGEKKQQEIKDQASYDAARDLWERRKMLNEFEAVNLRFVNRDLSNAMSRFEPRKRAGVIRQVVKVMEEALEEAELATASDEVKESLLSFLESMLYFTETLKNRNLGIEKFQDQLEIIKATLDTSEAMSDSDLQNVLSKIERFPMETLTIVDAEKVLDAIKRGEEDTRFRLFDALEELVDIKTRDLEARVEIVRGVSPRSYKKVIAENNDALLTIYEELKRSRPTVAEEIILNKIPPLRNQLRSAYGK